MPAKLFRRASAYMLDMIILGFIITISLTLFSGSNVKSLNNLNDEVNTINETLLENKISLKNYVYRYAELSFEIDKYEVLDNILNCLYIIGLFIYIPFFMNGQTLGMKILGIKVVKNDGSAVNLNDLLFRSLLIYSLGYLIITLASIYIMPSFSYFMVSSIFSFLEFLLVITSLFMILYRRDHRTFQDMITKTKVIQI